MIGLLFRTTQQVDGVGSYLIAKVTCDDPRFPVSWPSFFVCDNMVRLENAFIGKGSYDVFFKRLSCRGFDDWPFVPAPFPRTNLGIFIRTYHSPHFPTFMKVQGQWKREFYSPILAVADCGSTTSPSQDIEGTFSRVPLPCATLKKDIELAIAKYLEGDDCGNPDHLHVTVSCMIRASLRLERTRYDWISSRTRLRPRNVTNERPLKSSIIIYLDQA